MRVWERKNYQVVEDDLVRKGILKNFADSP